MLKNAQHAILPNLKADPESTFYYGSLHKPLRHHINMVFVSICTALYNYVPQGDNELVLEEGDLVYVLEKSTEDDWWKAKKRARPDEDEEPIGLIPNNYVEDVSRIPYTATPPLWIWENPRVSLYGLSSC